jgi:Tol biopolymer transport system component
MSAHHHRRRTAVATAVAGCVALVLAAPAQATFPGHNGRIAFGSATDHGRQLFTVRPNGRDLQQITHVVGGDAGDADWSPDGRLIAFDVEAPDSVQLGIMNADGSGLVMLPKVAGNIVEADPSFTPDGRRIIFLTFDGTIEAIWSMDLDGTHRHLVAPLGAADPNVSPDGRRLAFVGFNGEPFGQALTISGVDGSHPVAITPFSFNVGFKLDWAPDGRHLGFIHNADFPHPNDSANIATIRPDGTGLRFITNYHGGQVNAFFGSYSPDGRWIVFRLEDHGRFGLYKMRPDGTHLRAILGLSSFRPGFIDWGASTRHNDDNQADGNQDGNENDARKR